MSALDTLEQAVSRATQWPPREQESAWAHVRLRRAFRQADEELLRQFSDWDRQHHAEWYFNRKGRDYITDPLPGLIARAFADLLWGEDPEFTAATPTDQDNLTAIVKANCLPSELHRATRISVSEGEVWWRIYVDKDVSLHPMVQFVSRGQVIPMMHGRRVVAVAFISTISRDGETVLRHVEVQGEGEVRNLLFRGTPSTIGTAVVLDTSPATAGLPEVWRHRLPMLAGRVLNSIDEDPTLGRSEYQGVERLLLALNEAATIGAENARLTAKKRLFVNGALTEPDGTFDAGSDVIQVEADGGIVGEGPGTPPIKAVEYSFDAQALVTYTADLTDRILTRCGVAPQLVGLNFDGHAESGAALRARMMHSVLAAQGKGRYWDDELPRILTLCQLVDAMDGMQGGFGRPWATAGEPPAVERASVLPTDQDAEATRHATLVAAEIESRQAAVESLHPDWTDEQVVEELARISGDVSPGVEQTLPADDASPLAA